MQHPHNVLHRYTAMGTWKTKLIKKMGKRSWTGSKRARVVVKYPPVGGWPGGLPEHNGFKPGGK